MAKVRLKLEFKKIFLDRDTKDPETIFLFDKSKFFFNIMHFINLYHYYKNFNF